MKQFQSADKNKNGSLTFDECLGLTEQLNIQMDKERLVELFQVISCKVWQTMTHHSFNKFIFMFSKHFLFDYII